MSNVLELKHRLLSLSIEDRAELAECLIESLDDGADVDAAAAWEVELKRRAADLLSGEHQGEPADLVMERLRRKHS